jgi:hypothetical protein
MTERDEQLWKERVSREHPERGLAIIILGSTLLYGTLTVFLLIKLFNYLL